MAAWLHAWLRVLTAKGWFAYLQSAATGGYGAASLSSVTRGLAAVFSSGGFLFSEMFGKNGTFTK